MLTVGPPNLSLSLSLSLPPSLSPSSGNMKGCNINLLNLIRRKCYVRSLFVLQLGEAIFLKIMLKFCALVLTRENFMCAFFSEAAVDDGGPRKEFFMSLLGAIANNGSLLDGPPTL